MSSPRARFLSVAHCCGLSTQNNVWHSRCSVNNCWATEFSTRSLKYTQGMWEVTGSQWLSYLPSFIHTGLFNLQGVNENQQRFYQLFNLWVVKYCNWENHMNQINNLITIRETPLDPPLRKRNRTLKKPWKPSMGPLPLPHPHPVTNITIHVLWSSLLCFSPELSQTCIPKNSRLIW